MKERLGERIRRKRAEHKLGLRETATKVGISPTYLSRIETMDEKTPPAEDVIRKLATLLTDDFDELMQLAGRVPEDVEKVIKGDPSMPAFLRTAKEQKLSGDDLMKLIEAQKKGKRQRARTASEAEQRAGRLRAELVRRQVHADVLKACRAELLEENYFPAVLEATKSVAEKVRQLSGLTLDGSELVDEALGTRDRDRRPRDPILALNTLRSTSEQSEQRGMMHVMKGIFAVSGNPTAHEAKARWAVDEREALDLLTMVSVVHRRLDGAVRVPRGGAR
ncbi:MAG: TIGR02391 family protein [Myxococcales bacterium]|nr:TIGR02391 family protein [Myxococcales bacterium]